MKLAEVSVRRPVFAIMMSLALIVLGWSSYGGLGLDLMPRTDSPTVNVRAGLQGASAEEIETTITRPIEAAVNTINGIDELRCSSNQGNGNCTITFVLERDIEAATQDVRDKVATVRFPRDTDPPVVSKIDPDAAPILTLVVFSKRAPKEITQIADTQIKQALETVQDVGEVSFFGDRRREIRVLLDPNRVNAYGLTVAQIGSAVDRQNTEIPGGSFIAGPSEFSMRTMGRLRDVAEFRKIVLAAQGGSVVTLGDVARITDANEEVRSQTRLDGENAISMSIRKQSGSNTVTVVDRVMERLELHRHRPADAADRVIPAACDGKRPLGGAGGTDGLQRLRHPRRDGARPQPHQRGGRADPHGGAPRRRHLVRAHRRQAGRGRRPRRPRGGDAARPPPAGRQPPLRPRARW